ncbi:CAP domain-containing protein [Spirillospora sp. CA-294931]|uniref:CAP domain-containing protein n=1 Tax=Spirillospora sp. CA-294931 TaxID=3240042 RepID=UPI003D94FF0C
MSSRRRTSPRPTGRRRRASGRPPRRTAVIVAAVTGSVLAIGTGVAIERAVSGSSANSTRASSRTMPSTAPETTPSTQRRQRTASGDTPTAAPSASTPPLKRLRGKPARPTKKPAPTASPTTRPPSSGTPAPSSGPETQVVELTNKERAEAGCPALRVDERLVTSARRHSNDMAANNYFDHTSQNGDSPWKRMEDAGYPSPGAENIAKGQRTAAAVMKAWMNSPGHRDNILNCGLRAIGVGMASGSGGPLWTQNFGWK